MSTKLSRLLLLSVFLGGSAFSVALEVDSPPRRHVVEIRDFGFHPKHLVAQAGDTVVWINRDLVPHTATASDGQWDSGELNEAQSWHATMRRPGQQDYYCDFHPHMTGVIDVRADATR